MILVAMFLVQDDELAQNSVTRGMELLNIDVLYLNEIRSEKLGSTYNLQLTSNATSVRTESIESISF